MKDRLLSGALSGSGNTTVNQAISRSFSTITAVNSSESAMNPLGALQNAQAIKAMASLPPGVTDSGGGWYTLNPSIVGEDIDDINTIIIKQYTSPDMYSDVIFNDKFVNISSTDSITLIAQLKFTGTTSSGTVYDLTSTYTQHYSSPTTGPFLDPVTGESFSDFFYSRLSFTNDRTTGTITLVSGEVLSIDESYSDAILDIKQNEFDTEAGTLKITSTSGYEINVTYDAEGDGQGTIKQNSTTIGSIYLSYYESEDEDGTFEEDVVYYTLDSENNAVPHSVEIEFLP